MEFLNSDLVIPIGLGVALVLLLLLARGRGPRRIGMDGGREHGGAVSRTGRSPKTAEPTEKRHTRHDDDWRTDSLSRKEKPRPASDRSSSKAAEAPSVHDRLQAFVDARRAGETADPSELLRIAVTSKETQQALPMALRVASIVIWIWLGLWGFSMVMAAMTIIDEGPEAGGLIAVAVTALPVALGLAGLRMVKRFRKRIEQSMSGTGR